MQVNRRNIITAYHIFIQTNVKYFSKIVIEGQEVMGRTEGQPTKF
jgi:hypothetical protein